MIFKSIVITGGAGFVGSNLAIYLKSQYPGIEITVLDNLKRRGSELNLPTLKTNQVLFIHGDIRNREDLNELPQFDLMIECSAEPSVLAGVDSSPEYLLNTNLVGTLNCLKVVRKCKSAIIFLSTSRVYPIKNINSLPFIEENTRYSLKSGYNGEGISDKGISEEFPLNNTRSLYGTSKLCSELVIQEYADLYGIITVINRCGLLSGPRQMGKTDQGVIMLWLLNHILGRDLKYIGYGGEGKQVRDVLHINDLCRLVEIQMNSLEAYNNQIYNVGGGIQNSISLCELTKICEKITGNRIKISKIPETRPNDLIWYITDSTKIIKQSGWAPLKGIHELLGDMKDWIIANKETLSNIL